MFKKLTIKKITVITIITTIIGFVGYVLKDAYEYKANLQRKARINEQIDLLIDDDSIDYTEFVKRMTELRKDY
jgi:hypothetical protein